MPKLPLVACPKKPKIVVSPAVFTLPSLTQLHLKTEIYIANKLTKGTIHSKSVSASVFKIAVVATVLSMAIMLLSVSAGVGLQNKIQSNLAALHGHFSIQNFDSNSSEISLVPVSINESFQQALHQNGVKQFHFTATKAGIIRTETTFEGFILKGVANNFQSHTFQDFILQGQIPKFSLEEVSNQVVISNTLAKKLQLQVGDALPTFFLKDSSQVSNPNQRNFKIAAIYSTGIQEFDQNYVIGDIRHIQRINKWKSNQVGAVECFSNNFDAANRISQNLYQQLPPNLDVVNIQNKNSNLFEWLKIFDFNIFLILGIMFLVSGVNIIVAILVLILENVSLIGILKSIGYTNQSIRKIFMYQTLKVVFYGVVFGNALAYSLIILQQKFQFIQLNPENYYVTHAPLIFHLKWFLAINFGFIALIYLILFLPSALIIRLKPSEMVKFNR